MTTALLLMLMVPLYFAITTIVDNAELVAGWSKSLARLAAQPPPAWVAALPVVGAKLAARWQQLAAAGPEELAVHLSPHAQTLVVWFVGQVGSIGMLLVQFLLTVIIAAILYANGETAARGVDRFARRLAGPQGENAVASRRPGRARRRARCRRHGDSPVRRGRARARDRGCAVRARF